jgi:hypothetical protein
MRRATRITLLSAAGLTFSLIAGPGIYQVYVGGSSALADLPLRGSFSIGNQ